MEWLDTFLETERLPDHFRDTVRRAYLPLAQQIACRAAQRPGRLLTVGLCGPQGSGKTTLAAALVHLLAGIGLDALRVSLDDFYLGRTRRAQLAQQVHPLLVTRGVPGTHDVPAGLAVFAALSAGEALDLPVFDKARDEPRPAGSGVQVSRRPAVLLFEGWCVGARPQAPAALHAPVNALERDEDPDGQWRAWVNQQLAGDYQRWFAAIDMLVLLRAADFAAVLRGRREQGDKLRRRLQSAGGDTSRLLDENQLVRFVSHFERLTRHIQAEMPARADVVLDADQRS